MKCVEDESKSILRFFRPNPYVVTCGISHRPRVSNRRSSDKHFFFFFFFFFFSCVFCASSIATLQLKGPILPSAYWEWHQNHLPEDLREPGKV